ncbi:MAG: cell division protein ZapA [Flavobacteriaceae bacterium]|nr:cell division protein ZapA [Flavobacteriaceae bacterium]MCY4266538.1 cell division protein ZapA [Flavobacteriaceae bacterium]MCY4299838.1 cell division protein ZapA [Flavobacteriaceae bacterium]
MNYREVKLIIGGRVYPVNSTSEQETILQATANQINEELLSIEAKHYIKDKQDSLAILVLQLMMTKGHKGFASNLKTSDKKQEYNQEITDIVDTLISKIDFHLKVD